MAKQKTNILMLVTDHQLYYRHGWENGIRPLTPSRDALAKQGVSFDRAYAITPLCGPARRSLLCGQYPHIHRNFHNQNETAFTSLTYLEYLKQAGYAMYSFGKWHAGPGTAHDHGCKGLSLPGYGNPYTTEAYERYCKTLGIAKASHTILTKFWNNDTSKHFPLLQEGNQAYQCKGSWCGETAFGITNGDKRAHECFFLSSLAQQALQECADNPEQPFHLRVDFWGPHQPYFPTQEFLDLYNPSLIAEYGNFNDTLEHKPKTYRRMNQPIADDSGQLMIPSVFSWKQWQRLLQIAYAQTTMIDEAIGTIIDTLDRLGLAENTMVILTSDHGDALASHGGMFDKGSFMTEETIRIPLVLRYPGHLEKNTHCNHLVNTLDIPPTLLDCVDLEKPEEMVGESLLHCLEVPPREELLLESYGQGYRDKKGCRTLITKNYKYTRNEDDIDELYDLVGDPYELNNLSINPSFATLKKHLAGRLLQQLITTNDPELGIFFTRS